MPKLIKIRLRILTTDNWEEIFFNPENAEALWQSKDKKQTLLRTASGLERFIHPADVELLREEDVEEEKES